MEQMLLCFWFNFAEGEESSYLRERKLKKSKANSAKVLVSLGRNVSV